MNRRFPWGKLMVYVLAVGLAVTGAALLLGTEEPAPPVEPEEEKPSPLDPDQGVGLALFRHDESGLLEEPWRVAMDSVAAGERLLVTYHLEVGRGPHLAVVLLDDQGGLQWLLPQGGPGKGFPRSVRVEVPAAGVRLPTTLEAPRAARRIVLFAVATAEPLGLAALAAVLGRQRAEEGFYTRPPRLDIRESVQHALSFDVLP